MPVGFDDIGGVPVVHQRNERTITADEWKIWKLQNHWQFWIGPTFVPVGTHSSRVHRLKNFLELAGKHGSTSYRYLIYVVRWERGELGGRPHCHLFLGGLKFTNIISMRHILIADWRKLNNQSRVSVSIFNRQLLDRGAWYVANKQNALTTEGGLQYEVSKFSRAAIVHFSKHAEEVLDQLVNEPSAACRAV